jgi:putative transposase
MRERNSHGASRRKGFTTTTRDKDAPAPDLDDRNVTASAPDKLWVADITCAPTLAGFLFVAIVLDVLEGVSDYEG